MRWMLGTGNRIRIENGANRPALILWFVQNSEKEDEKKTKNSGDSSIGSSQGYSADNSDYVLLNERVWALVLRTSFSVVPVLFVSAA